MPVYGSLFSRLYGPSTCPQVWIQGATKRRGQRTQGGIRGQKQGGIRGQEQRGIRGQEAFQGWKEKSKTLWVKELQHG